MYRPKFQILVKAEQFPADDVICLGSQLIEIVNILKEFLAHHVWYGANIFPLVEYIENDNQNPFSLFFIGDDDKLIKIASNTDQFFAGVLFAIEEHHAHQNFDHIHVDTEDEQFRAIDVEGVLIEIRFFDTSFFSIYTENYNIIEELSKKLKIIDIHTV